MRKTKSNKSKKQIKQKHKKLKNEQKRTALKVGGRRVVVRRVGWPEGWPKRALWVGHGLQLRPQNHEKKPRERRKNDICGETRNFGRKGGPPRGGLAKNEKIHLCPTNGKCGKLKKFSEMQNMREKEIGRTSNPPQTPNLIGVWERRGWVCPPPSSWEVRFFSFVPLSFFFFSFFFFGEGVGGTNPNSSAAFWEVRHVISRVCLVFFGMGGGEGGGAKANQCQLQSAVAGVVTRMHVVSAVDIMVTRVCYQTTVMPDTRPPPEHPCPTNSYIPLSLFFQQVAHSTRSRIQEQTQNF